MQTLIQVLTLLFLPLHGLAQAPDPTSNFQSVKTCADYSYEDLNLELENRIKTTATTKENLQILIKGTDILDVPAALLFSIDLEKPEAVAKRVSELKTIFLRDSNPEIPDDEFLACARSVEGLSEKISILKKNQLDISKYRLVFLTLPADKRTDLLETQKSGVAQREQQKQLSTEIDAAKKDSLEAEKSIERAEEQVRQAVDQSQKELASHRAILEKTKQDIAQAQITYSTELKSRSDFYRIAAEQLSTLAAKLSSDIEQKTDLSRSDLKENYDSVNVLWRLLVDKTFSEFLNNESADSVLPQLPSFPGKLLAELKNQPAAIEYEAAYEAVKLQRAAAVKKRAERTEEFKNNHYKMLLQSSRLRSKYLQQTLDSGDSKIIALSNDYFLDLWREIRVVPYRALAIFYSVAVDVQDRLTSGVSGIISLIKDAFLLFLFIAIPISMFLGLKRLTARVDRIRDQLMREGEPNSWKATSAIWLKRINPYLPWVLMLVGFWLAEALLANSELENIRDIFSYVKYYIWFRIFKLFVTITLSRAAYSTNLRVLSSLKPRIEKTTNIISIFFFAAFVLLRITEGTVGAALVYRIVAKTTLYIGWGILAYCTYTWRDHISSAVVKNFPEKVSHRIQHLCQDKWVGFFICLPTVFALSIVAIARGFNHWLSKFEFYKKVSVEILKRKLDVDEENQTAEGKTRFRLAKQKYLEYFSTTVPDDQSLIIKPSHGIDQRIENIIQAWLRDESDDFSMAIIGEKGVGKSTILSTLKERFHDTKIIELTIPPKLLTKEKVKNFICDALNINNGEDFDKISESGDKKEKTLVFIDEAHNMFLAELGGFDGYKCFLELVNAKLPNVFWCVVYNRRAWKYLDNVLNRNQFFRNVIEIKAFSDIDVQNMIMTRHRKSGFALEFDDMILAASKADELGGIAHAEAQFFRLLWGLAKGNPRTAIALWQATISMKGANKVLAGIPKPHALKELNQLNEGNFFVFGSILTHENLNTGEAIITTNLPEGVVRNALKIGEDIEALERAKDGRYRVSPLAQSRLIDFLLDKNIVYE